MARFGVVFEQAVKLRDEFRCRGDERRGGDAQQLLRLRSIGLRHPVLGPVAEKVGLDLLPPVQPPMTTLLILGGRKDKIRPGDVLGALTGEAGFTREQVGKITVTDQNTYVAVVRDIARDAVRRLAAGKLKGRPVKVRALERCARRFAARKNSRKGGFLRSFGRFVVSVFID